MYKSLRLLCFFLQSNLPKSSEGLLPLKKRKGYRAGERSVTPLEHPFWLPLGWRVEQKIRANGSSKGAKDKYYIEPNSGRRLRSRKEVEYFVKHGYMLRSKQARATQAPNLPEMDSSVVPTPTSPTRGFRQGGSKQLNLDLNMDPMQCEEQWLNL